MKLSYEKSARKENPRTRSQILKFSHEVHKEKNKSEGSEISDQKIKKKEAKTRKIKSKQPTKSGNQNSPEAEEEKVSSNIWQE